MPALYLVNENAYVATKEEKKTDESETEKIFEKNDSLQIQSIETNLHSIEEGHKESISIESDNLKETSFTKL